MKRSEQVVVSPDDLWLKLVFSTPHRTAPHGRH